LDEKDNTKTTNAILLESGCFGLGIEQRYRLRGIAEASRMGRISLAMLSLGASVAAVGGASLSSSQIERILQNNDGYTQLDDLTGYSLSYSNCVRVKIPQESDDDAVEGNVNFYNGSYRAQYQIFATFHLCGTGNGYDQTC